MYIAIAGNIGAGKTTLTEKLAKHLGWKAEFEHADHNPYLADFYEDMNRWAFHVQVFFLNSRFNQIQQIKQSPVPVIQDRSIFEDAQIFARNLYQSGSMEPRDYDNYMTLYRAMTSFLMPPALLVYLRADVDRLMSQIRKRNRGFEKDIPESYIANLNTLYEDWIAHYSSSQLLIVDTHQKDFVANHDDFLEIAAHLQQAIGKI